MRSLAPRLALAALALGCATAPTAPPQAGPVFIENDYPAALAQAKDTNKLLFVDFWAP